MRRSICYSEPNQAQAGERNTWHFIYTPSTTLPKGSVLRLDFMSDGREIDWEIPSVDLKQNQNVIYGLLENGKVLPAKEIEIPEIFNPQYEFVLPTAVEAGGSFTIAVGSPKPKDKQSQKNGTRAQTYAQRRRTFLLYIDPTGKRRFEDPETFSLDIRGNVLHTINVVTPSIVARNRRFDILVRFEDEFGNLTSNAPENTLIEVSYEHLRESLNWKLFVPETGFISLPNLYFNEPGTYTIQLKNTITKEVFRSPPIRCFLENSKSMFWGLLHGESVKVDSTENIESCLRHFRDEEALNFLATSPFENQSETPNETWKLILQNIAEFDEADRFTTFLGFQWQGENKSEGLRQFVYAKENKPILRKKDAKNSTLKRLYKSLSPKECISIPCFTMAKGLEYNFADFTPEFERVVEIYNSWGSSECTKKAGNPRPIKGPSKNNIQEAEDGSIIRALLMNKRFGFVAGGLDDRGAYADLFENGQEQYSPGLTAIIANEYTRSALFEALYNRSCYATTGERIVLGLFLAGLPMGTETNTLDKHGLNINRHLSGYVAGTSNLKSIELIRNGKVIKTFHPETYHYDFTFDDLTPLLQVTVDAKDKKPPFVFYYLRVTQDDDHMAWSSPIWIDYVPGKPTARKIKPSTVKKEVAEFDEDFDTDYDELDEEEDDFDDEE
ncbi:MAG TPA: DUF3604 domain-containing protein [Waddliaceae bacterium]